MNKEIGTLVVVLLKARNLHDKHSLYRQDVFAQVAISNKTKHTGIDVKGGQHPVWDEELRFRIYEGSSEQHRILEVSCWSKEPRGADVIGKGTVDVSDTLRTGEFDDWVKLELDGVYRGEVYLEMTYFASGPPPLQRRASKLPNSERLARPAQPYAYPALNTPSMTTPKSLFPTRPSPGHRAQNSITSSTSPTGTHLVPPPSSVHSSPGSRHDGLPSSPENPGLTSEAIPAILRAGKPPGPSPDQSSYPLPPLPPEHPANVRMSVSPPNSPPRAAVSALAPYPQPGFAYAPPPSLRPGPHPQGEQRHYPYNNPPAPAEYHPLNPIASAQIPIQMPMPLLDEPSGFQTPTQFNPQRHLPVPGARTTAPAASAHHTRAPSREERDRLLALEIERAEEERRKAQEEAEERDFELARKLDLELNLPRDDDAEPVPAATPAVPMPGGW